MTNWLNHFSEYLAANGAGVLGETLFRVQIPDKVSADLLVTLVAPYEGSEPDVPMAIHYPRVQILHRAATWAAAWNEAMRIYKVLVTGPPFRVGSPPSHTLFAQIQAQQAPFLLGQDDCRAWQVACNYELKIIAD